MDLVGNECRIKDSDAVPVAIFEEDAIVEVLARYGDYNFVKTKEGKAGWLYIAVP